MASAADLLGSTSVNQINKGFPEGFFNAVSNPDSRLVSVGGICEDAMGALMAGLSSFGNHIGVTSSYSAFIAALEHVAARLHGIGQQARESRTGQPYNTWIMINAHAGVKTGEDGPTHADPQALQLLQECFPDDVLITLTPWDPQEVWPLLVAGLKRRPAILAPFVTRPAEKVVDRAALKLPPAHDAVNGIYAMRRADSLAGQYNGTIVLQGNGVASIFVNDVLPRLDERGFNLNVYYITSVELFKSRSQQEQDAIFPESLTFESMGITDFTLPTLYQWVRTNDGLRRSLHSFRHGHYLGSGSASKVLEEAGVHAEGQLESIIEYAVEIEKKKKSSTKVPYTHRHTVEI
jgi:transketolase